jgi:hypothetical protein
MWLGDFFNVQKQVLLDLAHASKDDLSALESISPNPTICYLNSAPIPQQFSDNSEPVVMFQPPSTAKADLGGQSSPQNEYNFRSFINQRVVDFLGDELQSLNVSSPSASDTRSRTSINNLADGYTASGT